MADPAYLPQSNGKELWLTVPRSLRRDSAVVMRVAHCSCYSGCFLSIERLYPPTAGCLREAASAVELGEPAVATAASKTDQSKVGKTTSADQQASPTNQGEFGETSSTSQHGTRTDQGDLGRTPPPPPPQRKPEQPRTNASMKSGATRFSATQIFCARQTQ